MTRAVLLGAVCGLLAACGSSGSNGGERATSVAATAAAEPVTVTVTAPASTVEPAVTSAPQTVPTVAGPPGEADALAACGEVRGDVRRVRHARGTAEVPLRPQRVVVLDTGELDAAAALGVEPVGVIEVGGFIDVPSYVRDVADGAENVGPLAQPNVEAIARLRPDLILGNQIRHADIYPQLAGIAPTVFAEDIGPTWRANFVLDAIALGRCERAREVLAAYDAKLADLRAALGGDAATTEISVLRGAYDRVRMYERRSFIGSVLDDVGLGRPAPQRADRLMEEIGLERIPDADGDVLFITSWGPVQPALETLEQSPRWAELRAVRDGRVFRVDDATWMLGLGPVAATSVLDDLREHLVAP